MWNNCDYDLWHPLSNLEDTRLNCLSQRNSVAPSFHIIQSLLAHHIHEHTPAGTHTQPHTHQGPAVERSVTMAEFSNWLWTAASAKALVLSETCQCLASVTIIFLCRTAQCETPGLGHYPATFPLCCHMLQRLQQLLLLQLIILLSLLRQQKWPVFPPWKY